MWKAYVERQLDQEIGNCGSWCQKAYRFAV